MGGKLTDSYLDEGFILDKSISPSSPKRIENAKILVANTCKAGFFKYAMRVVLTRHFMGTAMDTDKIKVFGARVKVDGTGKLAELERAERVRFLPPPPCASFSPSQKILIFRKK